MALRDTLKARWFWYSNLCVLCWGGWALLSRLGSREIPPQTMQFLFTIGTLPVGLALLDLIKNYFQPARLRALAEFAPEPNHI
jgi:TRAP-type C4-dicarboxylate transport system permease small subunit